jgi:DNA-binding CsgD family transcriptional regulator
VLPILCPTVVGRRAELAVLVGLLGSRSGGAVFVHGEAGIGKSRLVRELTAQASERSVLVLAGRAIPARSPTPYRPLAEALAVACRRSGPPQAPELVPFRPVLGRLVPEWHRLDLGGQVTSAVLLGEGVLRMIQALAGGGRALLVVEDVHWADPETLDVLGYLADHAIEAGLVCVMTGRPEPGAGLDLMGELAARRVVLPVELCPLTVPEVAEMARACLRTSALPDGTGEMLDRADGVPFLVEELLAEAVGTGGLVPDGADWTLHDTDPAVPRTLTASVERRIARFDPADGDVPRAAALLGRRADAALIGRMLDRPASDVLQVLQRCAAVQLMTGDPGGYRFRHALTRDAVLAGLAPDVRADLAARARHAVEEVHPGLPGHWCELAAELAMAVGDADDAAALLLSSGRRALRTGALITAAEALAQSRGLVPDESPLAVEIDLTRIEVASLMGDADTAFSIGAAHVNQPGDPALRARMHAQLAEAASAAARWTAARQQIELARHAGPDEATSVRMDALAAHVLLGAASPDEALDTARNALQQAERFGFADTACQALEVIGRIARTRDLRGADIAFTRQLDVAEKHGLTLWALRATHELGTLELMRDNGTGRIEQARQLAAASGALSTVATLDLQLAASAWLALDVPDCLAAARRCADAARRWNLDLLLAEALMFEAAAHSVAGRREDMERAIADAVAVGGPTAEVEIAALTRRGMLALMREDRAAATAAYDDAVALARKVPTVYMRTYWNTWALLRTVHGLGGVEARAEVRSRSPLANPLGEAILGYGDAIDAGRSGRRDEAKAHFVAARAMLDRPRLAAQRFLAERQVAECALVDGWGDPVAWLTEAAAYARRHDHRDVERACRSLLRKAGAPLPRRRGQHDVAPELAALGVTEREADVLALVADGLTSREVAARLFLSIRTVDKHVERLLAKTGRSRRAELRAFRT